MPNPEKFKNDRQQNAGRILWVRYNPEDKTTHPPFEKTLVLYATIHYCLRNPCFVPEAVFGRDGCFYEILFGREPVPQKKRSEITGATDILWAVRDL